MIDFKSPVAQYTVVTLNYWAFTLTDGALRMLVVLFFHGLGFSPWKLQAFSCSMNFSAWSPTCWGLAGLCHWPDYHHAAGTFPADCRPLYAAG